MKEFRYENTEALRVRRDFYDRFSTRTQTWNSWLLKHIETVENVSTILDIGAGYGSVWCELHSRVSALVLTDLSYGMLSGARNISGTVVHRVVMNASQLAIQPKFADLVTAFNMLYHVDDRTQVYSEVLRVLRPGGRFIISTTGRNHLRELRQLVSRYTTNDLVALDFPLQEAETELKPWFPGVEIAVFPDALVVSDSSSVLSYVLSTPAGDALLPDQIEALKQDIERSIASEPDCAWHINTEVGIVVCTT